MLDAQQVSNAKNSQLIVSDLNYVEPIFKTVIWLFLLFRIKVKSCKKYYKALCNLGPCYS